MKYYNYRYEVYIVKLRSLLRQKPLLYYEFERGKLFSNYIKTRYRLVRYQEENMAESIIVIPVHQCQTFMYIDISYRNMAFTIEL